jgi:hypothetical protein
MIRQAHKIVSIGFVPIHDHFGIIVAIAPKRVRMQIAFVPVLGKDRVTKQNEDK